MPSSCTNLASNLSYPRDFGNPKCKKQKILNNKIILYFSYFIFYICVCAFALSNYRLFIANSDFGNNIVLLEFGFGWAKSPWYFIYKNFFSSIIDSENFLIALWALIPLLIVHASSNTIDLICTRQPRRFIVFLLIFTVVSWNTFLRFFAFNIAIPTAHFLFQSLAAALLLQSFFCLSPKFRLWFQVLAVSFHYSSLITIAIYFLCRSFSFLNTFESHISIRYSTLALRLLFIAGAMFSSSFVFFFISAIRDYSILDTLGTSQSDQTYVIIAALVSTFAFLSITFGVTAYSCNSKSSQLLNSYLVFSLTAATLGSLSISFLLSGSVGLSYRISYPIFVWSAPLFIASMAFIARLCAKLSRAYRINI